MNNLILSNPENLDEAIEQDPELKALRDSNPLCAELMNDPQTMKILVDPDNLRALADCPDLIDADFNDPDWSPPEFEPSTFDETAGTSPSDHTRSLELDSAGDRFEDANEEVVGNPYIGGENSLLEGFEPQGDDNGRPSGSVRNMKSSQRKTQGSSFVASIRDFVAAEIVGGVSDSLLGGLGGDLGTSAIEDQVTNASDLAENNANTIESLTTSTSKIASSDITGNIEDAVDKIEESNAETVADRGVSGASAGMVASGTAAGAALGTTLSGDGEKEESTQRSGALLGVSSFLLSSVSALGAAAKEKMATTLLGDDLGETVLAKMEKNADKAGR
jgi:hypothetical protein